MCSENRVLNIALLDHLGDNCRKKKSKTEQDRKFSFETTNFCNDQLLQRVYIMLVMELYGCFVVFLRKST